VDPLPFRAEFLAQILDHVAHPIFVKNRNFEFVFLNRALAEMVGIASEAMIGKTDFDFFPREQSEHFRRTDERVFATKRPAIIREEPITDALGEMHLLETTKVPLLDASGRVTHLVGIIQDITKKKREDDVLRRANEELEAAVQERTRALESAHEILRRKERLAVLGQLAGGVAHQIRNPLAAIKNAAYVIHRHVAGERAPHDEVGKAIEVIHDEVDGANQTITSLLDYARVRRSIAQPVAVPLLVDLVVDMAAPPPSVKVVRAVEELPLVAVDVDQVRGGLLNLVRNAVEAMPGGGTLTLSGWRDASFVALAIADTGPGLPQQVRARLFEPLVTTKPLGLGLGLVTTKTLIEGQGGTLVYEDVPASAGGGARFVVRLPVADV
jgi:PAS domain S-box-containing protein